MKQKIEGYVAVDAEGPLLMVDGILWHGSSVTLFQTSKEVQKAAQRTKTFAKKNGYTWSLDTHSQRLVRP